MTLALLSPWTLAAEPAPPLRADPQVKQEIDRTVATIAQANASGDRSAVEDQIRRLERRARSRGDLLAELALYVARAGDADDERTRTIAAILIDHYNFTATETVDAVLPRLDAARGRLLEIFEGLLAGVDRPHGGPTPDFGPYESALRAVDEPPRALARYMYDASPDEALKTLTGIYLPSIDERRAIERARSEIAAALAGDSGSSLSRAKKKTESLAQHAAWWVRLYAAKAVARRPELAGRATTRGLGEDPDELVRAALAG